MSKQEIKEHIYSNKSCSKYAVIQLNSQNTSQTHVLFTQRLNILSKCHFKCYGENIKGWFDLIRLNCQSSSEFWPNLDGKLSTSSAKTSLMTMTFRKI